MPEYQYDAIVFDMDGTLVDSKDVKTWAFGKLYEVYGKDIVEQVTAWHQQHEGVSRFVKFKHWQENLLKEPYTDVVGESLSNAFSELVVDAVVQTSYIPGALKFLKTYSQHLPLFVASGTPESELQEIVVRRGMQQYFQGVYGSPKTKADILNRIILDNNWLPERVLMVGDALADWEGADAVGAKFLGIQESQEGLLSGKGYLLKNLENMSQYLFNESAVLENM